LTYWLEGKGIEAKELRIDFPYGSRIVFPKFSLSLLPFTLPLKWTKIPGKHKLSFISAAFLSSKEKWSKG